MPLVLQGMEMATNPRRELFFGNEPFRQVHHEPVFLFLRSDQIDAVQLEEAASDDQSGSLVAVYEGMVPNDREGIGGCEGGKVRQLRRVCQHVPGPSESRSKESRIAYAVAAAMLGQLATVDRKDHVFPDPGGLFHGSNRRASAARR